MQSRFLKILLGIVVLLFIYQGRLQAQISSYRLKEADSLYVEKKYTQSIEHYQTILSQHEYTPAMLLKMAHIQEGLNHVGQALYYLNLYYLATKDKSALSKMEELATRYNLEGYESTDEELALSFYHKYHFDITLGLTVVVLFLVSLAYSIKRKGTTARGFFRFYLSCIAHPFLSC